MKAIKEISKETMQLAEKYAREQLAVMDGSADAGIKRIGTERFGKMVEELAFTQFFIDARKIHATGGH